ncbi:hypothetical protein DICPUDRAFT_77355 [Dictyostelium purpureum]|uniref:Uncharacterized protein n=1 Tax=Dictyostelium purpureum TaxID=5786 RepID=F0ZGD0_DICPU|nr:uncharacterized protein DICPUDRAFT_77355 [Dictyostelium purpureum]EGC36989.1 hypothetical protein DICPUDRAFT_77355 [Dictyostelium purpureum]|eukprot:XP_003286486.1 hypothetical protein DICPUDRAFT_77355 [Dictyostelium purpureum]
MHKTSHSEENNPNEGEGTAEDEDGSGQDEDNGTAGDKGRNGGITRGEERLARGHWFDKNEFKVSNGFTEFMDGNLTPTSSALTEQYRNNIHSGKEKIECISTIGVN